MAKRLSEIQKKEIIQSFTNGDTIDELSEKFKCTKLTITRNLKKDLGEEIYKDLIKKNKSIKKSISSEEKNFNYESDNKLNNEKNKPVFNSLGDSSEDYKEELIIENQFMEIAPLNYDIDKTPQKDLSSVPISDIDFPKVVYMIVDKKFELETKLLRDYPDWQFLSENELNRKTIEVYFDLKIAKRFCNKEQKVIKVPNTNLFKIVAPLLVSRGISRIVSSEKLIAL